MPWEKLGQKYHMNGQLSLRTNSVTALSLALAAIVCLSCKSMYYNEHYLTSKELDALKSRHMETLVVYASFSVDGFEGVMYHFQSGKFNAVARDAKGYFYRAETDVGYELPTTGFWKSRWNGFPPTGVIRGGIYIDRDSGKASKLFVNDLSYNRNMEGLPLPVELRDKLSFGSDR